MGRFFVAKSFTFDAGHRLVSHPELCRHPHGHTYRAEVVLEAPSLDANAMVCDYKALSRLVRGVIQPLDHAMILWREDPLRPALEQAGERVVVLEEEPTAEVLAKYLYCQLEQTFAQAVANPQLVEPFRWRADVRLVAVRLWETPTTWAEFSTR
ncbi:MAG: 6-carboxytetrahydropterin synthase [Thermoanaerobaculum sp.]|nr:6-carboxytetrahydropterin synthase [Thermoanaerobaculum sp.]MDW7966591.1 6-carboxytetrahydropterin synthase [Thermoanaerobaculum sp.]